METESETAAEGMEMVWEDVRLEVTFELDMLEFELDLAMPDLSAEEGKGWDLATLDLGKAREGKKSAWEDMGMDLVVFSEDREEEDLS